MPQGVYWVEAVSLIYDVLADFFFFSFLFEGVKHLNYDIFWGWRGEGVWWRGSGNSGADM